MEDSLGRRIAMLRRQKELKQEGLADLLGVSPQAVSKWENDQTCPDIALLPKLAEILNISVDVLLSGKNEQPSSVVQVLKKEERKEISDMILRLVVESSDGDKVKINLPMLLVQAALESGMDMPQISGNGAFRNIDLKQILQMVEQGIVGNLLEVESADGDIVQIFVE